MFGFLFVASMFITACRSQGEAIPTSSLSHNQVKIQVVENGFYRLTLDELQDVGLAVDALASDNLHLSHAGTAVPYFIEGDGLIFYGQSPSNRYTATRPYLLEAGRAGVTMMETAVPTNNSPALTQIPLVLRLEENNTYKAEALESNPDDPWFWDTVQPGQKQSLSANLPAVGDGSATLRLQLWGVTHNAQVENDHDFDLIVNEQRLATIRWDGNTNYTSQTELPDGSLKVGPNSLVLDNEIEGASSLDIMELNWLELVYMAPPLAVNDRLFFGDSEGAAALSGFSGRPILFNVSNPDAPQRLVGWSFNDGQVQLDVQPDMRIAAIGPKGYLTPVEMKPVRRSDWRNPENQADLLIITTDELGPALSPLIEAREAEGLSVALVPVDEIYDAFGFGQNSPESIEAFVTYAYENWQEPRPQYLFLVGDATSDYRNYLELAPENIVPAPMVPVQFSGETVSDARLAVVDGDMRPDLAVGRWPVSDARQVESLVVRTLAYEEGTAVNRALFTTDATEAYFATMAERLWTESGFAASQPQLLNGSSAGEVARQWNEGAWLNTYIGHGSVQLWGKDDVFNPESVSDLQINTPSISLQLTCLTGLFAHPQLTSLSETMLLHEQGPVLIFAATSLTLSNDQEPFAISLLNNLQNPEVVRIGDAFQQAKLSLAIENNGLREISDTFSLLGDPTAKIVRPQPEAGCFFISPQKGIFQKSLSSTDDQKLLK